MRKLNSNLITVVANGIFSDINSRNINYRVQLELPNCIDEWLVSNIKNRYILSAIMEGKEYINEKSTKENKSYLEVKEIKTINIEEETIKDTGKTPSFYGKSIFDFSEREIQDFATAFGIHSITKSGNVEELRKQAIVGYLKTVKGITDEQLKEYSFYKYDKARMKHYFDFSEVSKDKVIINVKDFVSIDYEREFKNNDEVIETGNKDIGDLFNSSKQSISNENIEIIKNIKQPKDNKEQNKEENNLRDSNITKV